MNRSYGAIAVCGYPFPAASLFLYYCSCGVIGRPVEGPFRPVQCGPNLAGTIAPPRLYSPQPPACSFTVFQLAVVAGKSTRLTERW